MGSSSQTIRYPVGTTGVENIDAFNRVLADLCTRSNPKDGAALTLRRLVEEKARDLSGEAFARFMDHIYECITTFLDNNEVSKNLVALRAIYELIDVTINENASKVAKFYNYMRTTFETKRDPEILVLASKVLGQLARSGGAMTADEVECQLKVALEWLHGERIEYRRFAAVLILKEMAENASTVFNVHVPEFVDAIWVALRDPTWLFDEKLLRHCVCAFVLLKSMRQGGVFSGEICFSQIAPRKGRPSLEALACVGNIAKAMGPTMEPHVRGPDLLEFARESVVVYLKDEDEATRKDVALCFCKLVANSFSTISSTQFSPSRINCSSGK
ncbi:Serine/threonine-protein kinase TOR [Capsicum baccatum]|uniref:Serine/threonine-protein kinase TOR n=1 Tax=Capsicum baccatum TaxID=33114 RepID=A0A2G2V6A2_CAPBA|nr:Serine/threonine-protein kinase TOR [Capsicum baccatum]